MRRPSAQRRLRASQSTAAEAASRQQLKQLEAEQAQIAEALACAEAEQREAGASGGELALGKSQLTEYNRLKKEAGLRSAALNEQISAKTRELRSEEPLQLGLKTRIEELASEKSSALAKVGARLPVAACAERSERVRWLYVWCVAETRRLVRRREEISTCSGTGGLGGRACCRDASPRACVRDTSLAAAT